MYLISVVVFIVIVLLIQPYMLGWGFMGIAYLIDYPSLLFIVLLSLPVMVASGLLKDFFHAFSVSLHRNIQHTRLLQFR